MNEWEFTADVASSINESLKILPELPFSGAKCEQKGKGSKIKYYCFIKQVYLLYIGNSKQSG